MLTDLVMQFQAGDFKKEWSDEELKMAEKVILREYPWVNITPTCRSGSLRKIL